MKTHVLLLIIALHLFVCNNAVRCDDLKGLPEQVLAIKRCFIQSSVRLLPELRYNVDTAQTPLAPSTYPLEVSTISPDGRRLFFIRELENRGWQSFFLDLRTGQVSVARMPDQKLVIMGGIIPLPYIKIGVWDPVDPAYIYAMITNEQNNEGNILYSIWRINIETMAGKQVTPPSTNELYNITPDGRYLLFYRREGGINQQYLYSLETHTWKPKAESMSPDMRTYAPNGEMISGIQFTEDQNSLLTITECSTGRLANVFNQYQVLLSVPNGVHPILIGTPAWLPDSSGLFVNIIPTESTITANSVWRVNTSGSSSRITSGVFMIANSQNGRYWLMQHGPNFYVISVDKNS